MSGRLDIDARVRITAAEATSGVRRDVSVMRCIRCPSCLPTYRLGPRCSACMDGLTTREERLKVRIPAGVTAGTRLRLAGKGHASTRDASGDLYLELEIAAERAAERDERVAERVAPEVAPP